MPTRKPSQRAKPPRRRLPAGAQTGVRIVVLSRNPRLYSTTRLAEAAAERGHALRVVDTLGCSIVVQTSRPAVVYEGRAVEADVVIPRIGASITSYGLAVVNQFDMMRVPVVNASVPIARSRDKLRCLQLLSRHGIPVPRTVMTRDRDQAKDALRRVGGLPVIVKLLQGTQGVGVMIAHTNKELETILDTMWHLGQEIILQQFVEESAGRDVRVLVVGERAVGAMRRRARKGEFRSNIHRGGEGERMDLTPEYAGVAVAAARTIGLEVAGVDLLEAGAGPLVMEVNSSPGFEGIEGATGLDIAGMVVDHAAGLARARRAESEPPAR